MNITDDFQELVKDLSLTEKLVILIVANSKKIKNTRLQKLSLIIKATLEGKTPESHGAYFFGGFSDEVEEGASALKDEGLLQHEPKEGFSLSPDGEKIAKIIEETSSKESKLVSSIVKKFQSFSDSKLTAFTYVLFPAISISFHFLLFEYINIILIIIFPITFRLTVKHLYYAIFDTDYFKVSSIGLRHIFYVASLQEWPL